MTESVGRGQGKVILLGEHAVVHGAPALVIGLDRGAEARARDAVGARAFWLGGVAVEPGSALERAFHALAAAAETERPMVVEVSSALPAGGGLGSSAAIGVATARAILGLEGRDALVEPIALAFERVFHGNPSGVDVAAAARGGVLRFVRGTSPTACAVSGPLPLCVGLTGRAGPTKEMVERVASIGSREPSRLARFVRGATELVEAAIEHLARGDLGRLGAELDAGHELLREVEVSTHELDRLVELARGAGAAGAKLTGAGGGGSVVALAPGRQAEVLEAWRRAGFDGFEAGVSG